MKRASQLLLLLGLCVYATAVWGQATTSLHGVVTDPARSAIPGAQVIIANSSNGYTRSTVTGGDGAYTLVEVLPGTYNIRIEAKGFQKYEQIGLVLRVELPATLNVQMTVGSVSEVVSVTAEAPALNTTDASTGHTMGASEIEELPIQAENMPLLLSFQPGVVYNGENLLTDNYDTRAGAVNGERSDQNNITLDGVSINNEFAGYAFIGVLPTTQFSVEEFRVTTSNYGASEGRSAGAQIDMVTKSGTNNFHGNLYEFNRNTAGEANDYFLKSSQLANGEPNVPQHLVRNIFGGTVGGPLKKDRLFFFFNYEGHRIATQSSQLRTIPSATLRDGIIQYQCPLVNNKPDTTTCPGMNVAGVSGQSYSIQPGYYALSPTQLAAMDPLGIGPSAVALKYFQSFPLPNDFTTGNIVNYAGYRFAAPTPSSDNWYIARLDYKLTQNGNHSLFFRGAARNDRDISGGCGQFLPGMPPECSSVDLSKGFVAGYTGVFGAHWVNNLRYGLTHQSLGSIGDSSQPWVYMRSMDQGVTYSSQFTSPVHDIVDTATWTKGSHTFQFGGNILLMRNNGENYGSSFSDALLNADWLASNGFANKNSPLNPAYGCSNANPSLCFPAVSGSFNNAYDFPLAGMMGIASEVDAQYNYKVVNATTASPLAQGAPIARHWAVDSYNLFFQDTWRATRSLSVTYGLNYQLMMPMTETTGQQVTPSVNMGDWFNQRASGMLKGIPASQAGLISFSPSGSFYGKPGLYSAQTKNFAPRIGLAWSPNYREGLLGSIFGGGKTVIRAGFGMYYDNFGPELATQYDAGGSFGLATNLSNPSATLTLGQAPRITSMNEIPTSTMPAAPPSAFPVTYPTDAFAIARGIDQSLKTPYSYAVDLSVQRELPGHVVLDVAYVGHFAHRLLAYDDIAAPLNLADPKSGIDWNAAAKRMSELWRAHTPESNINASTVGPTAQYWQDMFVAKASYPLCSTGGTTTSMLVAVYDLFGGNDPNVPGGCGSLYNETSASYLLDVKGFPTSPITGAYSYYNPQYSSLWDWRSIGHSNYHSLQAGLHKQMSQGLLFGFNYTYSRSMDIESMAERGVHYLTDSIINPFAPNQMYAASDFDLRHQINGYWLFEMPFGRGKAIGGRAGGALDALIGGWQLGGTTRWTSGFPVSVFMGYVWPTNWDEMGWADTNGKPIASGLSNSTGVPNIFKDPAAASQAFDYAFPGESGVRNNVRGQGFFATDMNLQKSWRIPRTENKALQLRWSVYNVFNNVRFDAFSMQDEWDNSNTFGNYTSTLTNPRVMEFALMFKF